MSHPSPPPMHRRLVAMLYDFLIGGALAALAGAIIAWLLANKGITIPTGGSLLSTAIFAMQLLVGFLYFQWYCLHKEQTLGMYVWKMKITSATGERVTYAQVFTRYLSLVAILLAGFLLGSKALSLSGAVSIGIALIFLLASLSVSYFSDRKRVLHEIISNTELIDCR